MSEEFREKGGAHGSAGSGEHFPVIFQVLEDHPEGMTIPEIVDFVESHDLIPKTMIDAAGNEVIVKKETRVRRAIQKMIAFEWAIEAPKETWVGKAVRYRLNPRALEDDLNEGLMELMEMFKRRFKKRLPQATYDRLEGRLEAGVKDVQDLHQSLLGMRLQAVERRERIAD